MNAKYLTTALVLISVAASSYAWFNARPQAFQQRQALSQARSELDSARALKDRLAELPPSSAAQPLDAQLVLLQTVRFLRGAKDYGLQLREVEMPGMNLSSGKVEAPALKQALPSLGLSRQDLSLKGDYQSLRELVRFSQDLTPGAGVSIQRLRILGSTFEMDVQVFGKP